MTMTPTTFSLCGTELTRTVRLSVCDCQIDYRQLKQRRFRQGTL